MGTVYVFFADGFEEIEASTTVDVLKRANLNVEMVSVTNEQIVNGAHEMPFLTDSFFKDHDYSDAIALVLPGGMPGAGTLDKHEGLRALMLDFVKTGKTMAAICAAPMVLGKLGLLKGRKATCYPGFEQYLEGADCTGRPVEVDGNFVTGKGPGTAMEFALAIVNELLGKEKVAELVEAMCINY